MEQELISIIVPVYNVEQYLEKCVQSILNQTYCNYEVILIDDGSKDKSGEICDVFSRKYEHIKVIHQENGGLSAARNTGLDKCNGNYVTFVDSDDFIQNDYLQNLWNMINAYDAEIAISLEFKFYEGEILERQEFDDKFTEIYNSQEALESMLYRKKINSYACGKLFQTSLFNDVRFPEGKLFEDSRTIYRIYSKANKIVFNPVRTYFYLQREGSIVNSSFNKKKIEQVTAAEEIVSFIDREYPTILNAAISKYFVAVADIYRRIPNKVEYVKEKKYVEQILIKYRNIVWKDKKNKKISRGMALAAMIDVRLLNYAGRIYQWLTSNKILRIKNPI